MMADLALALAVMTAVSIALFYLTCRLTRKLSHKARVAVVAIVTAAIIAFSSFFFDSRWLLLILPFQAAIIYTNFFMPLFAILAGALWKSTRTPAWRRLPLIVACAIFGYGSAVIAVTSRPPTCADNWKDAVCLQTSQSTCTAAAVSTLLRHHGIDANEQEMARLCLTRKRGTYLHGLYRGLRIKTQGTQYRVVVGSTTIDLLRDDVARPAILNVKLTKAVNQREPRYSKNWGWKVGIPHTVVLFGFKSANLFDMGDPGVGRELWNTQTLRDLWHGEYVYLEKAD
jgi:hypothetical protein